MPENTIKILQSLRKGYSTIAVVDRSDTPFTCNS